MTTICQTAESGAVFMHPPPISVDAAAIVSRRKLPSEFAHAVADAATDAAVEANAVAMIVFTTSGDMGIYVSKRRSPFPILVVTPTASIYRRLALLYGVLPVLSSVMRVKRVGERGTARLKDDPSTHTSGRDSLFSSDLVTPTTPSGSFPFGHRTPSPGGMGQMIALPLTHNTDMVISQTEVLPSYSILLASFSHVQYSAIY
jgi:hypothetical protein